MAVVALVAEVLLAGMAGLTAGALSMAAGEYVSVSSQADTERADTARDSADIAADPEEEKRALAGIDQRRGLDPDLAMQVAVALHATRAHPTRPRATCTRWTTCSGAIRRAVR